MSATLLFIATDPLSLPDGVNTCPGLGLTMLEQRAETGVSPWSV